MKRILIALAMGTMLTSAAHAGDLGRERGASTKDAPLPIPQAIAVDDERSVRWSGFYIGGQIGYGNANHDLTLQRYNGAYCFDRGNDALLPHDPIDPTDPFSGAPSNTHIDNVPDDGNCNGFADNTPVGLDNNTGGDHLHHEAGPDHAAVDPSSRNVANLDGLNSHGFIGGAQIGYDQQLGNRFVVGLFGAYNLASMKSEGSISDFDAGFKAEKGDEWSLGARVGFLATPRTMVYALAAYTQTDYKFSSHIGDASGSKTVDFTGVTVGGGIEIALTNNIFLGGEYTHTFYGDETVFDTGASEVGGFGSRVVDDLDEDKIMATLKIKLNSDLFSAR